MKQTIRNEDQAIAVAEYTDMMLEFSESYSLDASELMEGFDTVEDDDLKTVYDTVSKRKGFCQSYCSTCNQVKFYDEWENSYYCPVCEEQL